MGFMELAVIFLVAFLVLGPAKSIEMARTVGKLVRDFQRTFREIVSSVNLQDLEGDSRNTPGVPTFTPPSTPIESEAKTTPKDQPRDQQ